MLLTSALCAYIKFGNDVEILSGHLRRKIFCQTKTEVYFLRLFIKKKRYGKIKGAIVGYIRSPIKQALEELGDI